MNTFSKIAAALLSVTVMVGCNDLDTEPQGQYITDDQKQDALLVNGGLPSVVGIASNFSAYNMVFASRNDTDFGYASVMLALDSRGTDMVGLNTGYNWFASACEFSDCNVNGVVGSEVWYTLYRQISSANTLIGKIDPETEKEDEMFFLGQALAFRAFDYFTLAQLFQKTYVGNVDAKCVPLVTEENAAEADVNGCARSTVQQVYDRVLADLNAAQQYVDDSGLTPQDVLSSGAKRFLSSAAIHGLKARVYLVQNKWAKAAEEADAAIKSPGVAPYSLDAVSVPSFNSADASSWMWCIHLGENDRVVTSGIINWASHMGSLCYGYASYGGWRMISQTLYASIPSTDVRKGWFLNGNGESANLSAAQSSFLVKRGAPAYAQVKFAPYQDVLNNTVNAAPIPLMRVEEMYLILAEAQAMGGNPVLGAQTLTDFVKKYRDPEYTLTLKEVGTGEDADAVGADNAAKVQEAVWNQRRIELWGEGLSYFDLMRLKKPVDRRGGGWERAWVYNIPADDQIMVLPIPQSETNRNPLITPADNNPSVSKPRPVDDY